MIPEDEELNFAISPDVPEPRQIEEDLPLWLGAGRPHDIGNQGAWIIIGAIVLFIVIGIIGNHYTACPRSTSSSTDAQLSQTIHPFSQPEYFPAGWSFIKADHPIEMYKENQISTIPQDRAFFVSLRNINGVYLAVAEDATWNGWIKITGPERQIPMHPDFAGAKKFVEEVDWNSLESSYSMKAPSQEEPKTDLEALRASESETEGSDMALFQKNDSQQDRQEQPEITVQGEEAVIPQSPVEEKKVKLPKTKWYSEGASAPSFSWVCVEGQMRCSIYSDGQLLQTFFLEGDGMHQDALVDGIPRPKGFGCRMDFGKMQCMVANDQGVLSQRFSYDGRTFAQ